MYQQNKKCYAKLGDQVFPVIVMHLNWFSWVQFLSDDKELHSSAEDQENQEGPCLHKLKKMARKAGLLKSILSQGVPMFKPKYMPQCDKEGYYAPMQCTTDKSKCWCVNRMGTKIKNSREKRTRGKPDELDCSWKPTSHRIHVTCMFKFQFFSFSVEECIFQFPCWRMLFWSIDH